MANKKPESNKNGLLIKLFFYLILMKFGEVVVSMFHQVSSKSDEKQKSFINSPFLSESGFYWPPLRIYIYNQNKYHVGTYTTFVALSHLPISTIIIN